MLIFVITGSTTIASDAENTGSTLTSPKSTKLRPITRIRGALPHNRTQLSSMQENRLSSVQVDAPATEQFSETTEEPTSTTEFDVSSPSLQVTADAEVLTTSADEYKQTESIITVTGPSADISTSLYTERGGVSYKSYFIPASQLTTAVTPIATDDEVKVSVESLHSTTANLESNVGSENTTTEGSLLGILSAEDDTSLTTSASDENAVTSTTESLFQSLTRDSDQQHDEGESVKNMDTSHAAIGNAGEMNNEGDETKQGDTNTYVKILEEDGSRHGKEDEAPTESNSSEGAYNKGDISDSNPEEQNKNTEDSRQVDDNQSSGKLSINSGEGYETYPVHGELQNYGTPETDPLHHTSGAVTGEVTEASSPLPGSYETQTSTSSK